MPSVDKLKADQDNGKDPINGFYRARVESNLDPLHLGRIRARIPQIHGIEGDTALSNEALPWAYPVTTTGTGFNHGSCIVPETGDYVFIAFENGDRNSPIYFGGCYGIPQGAKQYGNKGDNPSAQSMWGGKGYSACPGVNELPTEVYSVGDSPNGKVIYKSPKGFIIMTNETDNEEQLIIADNDNQQIVITNPQDNSVSEIAIMGKDGQSIHVISKSGAEPEVAMLSADQSASIVITNGKITMKTKQLVIEAEESINATAADTNIKGNLTSSDGIVNLN